MTINTAMKGMWIHSFIRLASVLSVLALGSSPTKVSAEAVTPYPTEVHQMVQQRLVKGQPGSWSTWSPWTPCSRTCGGGVTVQTRECRSKPLGRHRRRVHSIETQHHCVGLYKRIHICNTKECPGTTDFRQEQCSRYDGQDFLGRAYTWEPFMDAPNQCALNCRAKGFRFYATLNATVEDGTPCRGYIIGHDTDRWVCITGQCKHVGCDGVVGSDQRYDSCGVCGGNNSTCRVISGLFTRPQLPVGYNLITQIPQAACNLSITELKRSRNYLALRKVDGTFILNGNWAINWSGEFDALGTKFSYHREDEDIAETITSPGPLSEPVDLMVIYQQPNPGIKYQYQLPVTQQDSGVSVYKGPDLPLVPQLRQADSPSPTKEQGKGKNIESRFNEKLFPYGNNVLGSELQGYSGDEAPKPKPKGKKRKFAWKITGFSECSKSCGGGVQTAVVVCIREHNQLTVPDKRCASLEKPSPQVMRCNLKPCVAEWVGGEWSECSVTCGEGVQTREILCRQQITPTLTMTVVEGACLTPPSPLLTRTRPCQRAPCSVVGASGRASRGLWTVGSWSQCSAKCGQGVQTRSVLCPSGDCNMSERPATETSCTLPPCQSHRHSHVWLYTDWTQECSASCGTGVQKRRIVCSAGPKMENLCDVSLRPDHQRACSSDKQCGALWFSGPWRPCTASCGWGRQSRSVVCISKSPGDGQLTPTADENCPVTDKPATEQQCKLQACGPEWYMGEWSQCSRSCDTGVQRRDVRCLDENQKVAMGCSETSKPPSRRSCNTHKCPSIGSEKKDEGEQSNYSPQDQPQSPKLQNLKKSGDADCKDMFHNCPLVVQARMCIYKVYRSSCCLSCQQHKL